MSTLLEDVSQGLQDQGLDVQEDHGGLVARGGPAGHSVKLWIDETDRVVRAELVLCYPVDDFSEDLCIAMDQLNEARPGVTISYQEQQRALVGSTVWSSPTRNPSQGQLHLLVGLLHQTKDRDAEPLGRIADGETTWQEIAEELLADDPQVNRPPADHFVSSEPPTRMMGAGWAEPATQDMDEGDRTRLRTTSHYAMQEMAKAQGPSDTKRRRRPIESSDSSHVAPPRKTSRLAFQMAVNAAEPKDFKPVDLTTEQRSLGRRLMKLLFYLALFCGAVWLVGWKIVKPMYPQPFEFLEGLFETTVVVIDEQAVELERRRNMQPGLELLRLELQSPMDETLLARSAESLGKDGQPALEGFIVDGATEEVRKRAYQLWRRLSFHEQEGARLALVKKFSTANKKEDVVVSYLANDIKANAPEDSAAIEALEWAPPDVWRALIEQLGRPGDGAADRAAALAKQLENDTKDTLVLRALVKTGLPPKEALATLIDARGLEWARGEGKELVAQLVESDAHQTTPLLAAEEVDRQTYAVELLTDAGTEEAAALLLRLLKDRKAVIRTRLAAASGIRKLGLSDATWPLVLIICTKKEDKTLKDAALRAIDKIRGDKAVAELAPYYAPDKPYNMRHYAVRGLGVVKDPAAVQVLVDMLQKEEDVKVRRLAARVLEEDYLEVEGEADSLNRGLAVFREVARSDADPAVRKIAQRLYDALTGG